jgi:hypothetical protein
MGKPDEAKLQELKRMLQRLDKAMQASPPGTMQGVAPLIPTGHETAHTPLQARAGIRDQGSTSTATRTVVLAAGVSTIVSLGLFALVFGGMTTPQRPISAKTPADDKAVATSAAVPAPGFALAPGEAAKHATMEALQTHTSTSREPSRTAEETPPQVDVKSKPALPSFRAASTENVALTEAPAGPTPPTEGAEATPQANNNTEVRVHAELDAPQLLRRGLNMLSSGNVNAAQLLLERAADLGSGDAAYALATTYDAAPGAPRTGADVRPNIELALRWYERASELGIEGASKRLSKLKKSSVSAR